MSALRGFLPALVLGVAAALVIVAISILPFLNPVWVGFEQDRAQAQAWTGYDTADLRTVTDSILADLVVGPPAFDVELDGQAVLDGRERQHMVDVRSVFAGFFVVAGVAAVVLVGAFVVARGGAARMTVWRRLARSGLIIATSTIVIGVVGILFFDQAFELFHSLFFPAGSYDFDSGTEKLVQLFPYQFWVETTVAVAAVIVGLSLLLWWYGNRRAAAIAEPSIATRTATA
jgi:integral membrane protein (TIGR01906 family)